ncbi:MAG: polysaccharide biosynthesis/export family protein, partial [Bacteroidota bacterium]
MIRHLISFLLIAGLFSCKSLAPNRMLKSDKEFPLASDSLNAVAAYVIEPFDKIDLKIFSNDGFKLVDITQNYLTNTGPEQVIYVVNQTGDVKLPVIGYVNLKGLTVEQSERMLETKYERYFNQPFVSLKVVNRHVTVFMGDGRGQVVPLVNENTTLFDVLAAAGGISDLAKAYRIKIIRGDPKSPAVYLADISTMGNVSQGNIRMMSNDIVHVEAVPNYGGRIYQRAFP